MPALAAEHRHGEEHLATPHRRAGRVGPRRTCQRSTGTTSGRAPSIARRTGRQVPDARPDTGTDVRAGEKSDARQGHRVVDRQPLLRRPRGGVHRVRRDLRPAGDAPRRAAGPLRRAGDHLHRLPGAGPAGGRGPGHLSHHDADAGRSLRHRGPRLLVLRLLVRLRDLRGRHRPVLGAQPGPGVPQLRRRAPARRRDPDPRAGRHRRRLGLPVRAALRTRSTWPSCGRCRTGFSSTS